MGALPHVRRHGDGAFGGAIADSLAARHPIHTAKHVARALSEPGYECSIRTAENILAGHLSAKSLTRLARAYGLELLIEAGVRVTGTTLENYIIEKARHAANEERRWAEVRRFAELQADILAASEARSAQPESVVGRAAEPAGGLRPQAPQGS